jgi:dienelactone hydrolase
MAGLLVLGAGAAIGIAYAGGARSHPGTSTTTGISTATSTTTTSPSVGTSTTSQPPAAVSADGTYAVATTQFDAGTTGAPAATPGAHLATTVWYPASSPEGGVADRSGAPYPLLVFSQGYAVAPLQYQVLLTAWASAGFVVAAPTYPHTDASPPTYLDESDIVNHPAELRTVIGAVVAMAAQPGSALFGLVSSSEIGLAGQSDGGDVSLAVAADTCCRYPGVKAVAILSGAELSSFGGRYFGSPTVPGPPLLVVQGSADTINPPACSVQIYDGAPPPKWYLDLIGAPHLTPYVDADGYETVVANVTTDFFDAELAQQPEALRAMVAGGDLPGFAQLSDGTTAPPPGGYCPGAP